MVGLALALAREKPEERFCRANASSASCGGHSALAPLHSTRTKSRREGGTSHVIIAATKVVEERRDRLALHLRRPGPLRPSESLRLALRRWQPPNYLPHAKGPGSCPSCRHCSHLLARA